MMKRQLDANASSLSSSSSRRENCYSPKTNIRHQPNNNNTNNTKCTTNNNKSNNIGCMSGIFRLLYNYNNRRGRRRFLTSGKNCYKQEKDTVSLSSSQEEKSLPRPSCNVPRSPTLPAEIRLSNTDHLPENFKNTGTSTSTSTTTNSSTRQSLVGLGWGLGFEGVDRDLLATAESAAEKRRKLLEALEKCDEDLKALKKIIDVVKRSNTSSTTVGVEEEDDKSNNNGNKGSELQPSPVSVLDEFICSPAALQIMNTYSSKRYTNGRVTQVQQKQKQKKKPGEEEIIANICFLDRVISAESNQAKSRYHHHEINAATSPLWASKAMVESVNEVCKDIAWGEKREIGRIGVALQDRICRDLIDEIVRELECCGLYSLPFEACKRSLRF